MHSMTISSGSVEGDGVSMLATRFIAKRGIPRRGRMRWD